MNIKMKKKTIILLLLLQKHINLNNMKKNFIKIQEEVAIKEVYIIKKQEN